MKIFVKDIPMVLKTAGDILSTSVYDTIIDSRTATRIKSSQLRDDVLITHATTHRIDELLKIMSKSALKNLDSLTVSVDDSISVKHFLKDAFTIVKAAGGVVAKEDQILLMYRLGKWDLPKGKLEKKEKPKQGAVREVEEECNIRVKLEEKVCTTWHTYLRNGKRVLKKTYWYRMSVLDDAYMKPQLEENIEKLEWMGPMEIRTALYNSYPSVRHVFHQYYKLEQHYIS